MPIKTPGKGASCKRPLLSPFLLWAHGHYRYIFVFQDGDMAISFC